MEQINVFPAYSPVSGGAGGASASPVAKGPSAKGAPKGKGASPPPPAAAGGEVPPAEPAAESAAEPADGTPAMAESR